MRTRIHLTGGQGPVVISQSLPIRIYSCLIDREDEDSVSLKIIDSSGDVTPVGGFQWSFTGWGADCLPTVTAELVAPSSVTATIYYQVGRVVYDD